MLRNSILSFVLISATPITVLAGPIEDGTAAMERKDYAVAQKIFQPLAEEGDAQAQKAIGRMLLNGAGVEKNPATALGWFLKAADQNDAEAQLIVGNMYESGLGVPVDLAEATKWYLKSANNGFSTAENNIGLAFE